MKGILPEVTAHWFTQQTLTALTNNGDATDSEVPCTSITTMTVRKCIACVMDLTMEDE